MFIMFDLYVIRTLCHSSSTLYHVCLVLTLVLSLQSLLAMICRCHYVTNNQTKTSTVVHVKDCVDDWLMLISLVSLVVVHVKLFHTWKPLTYVLLGVLPLCRYVYNCSK